MPKILMLSGSPVKNGSTDILLKQIAEGISHSSTLQFDLEMVRLNDFMYLPCQSCGQSPEPDYCLFQDEIYPVYDLFVESDIILFGSPIYFDSVSAQAKLFIDRCNCLRPYDFNNETDHDFKKILAHKRLGGMVLVGGERQEYEYARKVIAGFFKWTEIENCGHLTYLSGGMEAGEVQSDFDKLEEASRFGQEIVSRINELDL